MEWKRVKTGIEGLDELIEGGIPENFITLVAGSSGTGKTTFLMEFLVEGIKRGERGLYIGLGESTDIIKNCMSRYNMDLDKLGENDDLVFADIPQLSLDQIKELIEKMDDSVKRLVIDPISALLFTFDKDIDLRQSIRELVELIRDKGVTALISTEVDENSERISRFGIEDFLADGIVVLYYLKLPDTGRRQRGVEVRKMRGTAHSDRIHLYKLETGKGFVVYPDQTIKM